MTDRAPVNRNNTWAERTAVALYSSGIWLCATCLALLLMVAGAALARIGG